MLSFKQFIDKRFGLNWFKVTFTKDSKEQVVYVQAPLAINANQLVGNSEGVEHPETITVTAVDYSDIPENEKKFKWNREQSELSL